MSLYFTQSSQILSTRLTHARMIPQGNRGFSETGATLPDSLRNYPRTAVMLMWEFGLRYPDAGVGAADTSTTRRPVGSGPGSWRPSSRNAPAARGTSTATRTSAPPPNDVACDPSIGRTT